MANCLKKGHLSIVSKHFITVEKGCGTCLEKPPVYENHFLCFPIGWPERTGSTVYMYVVIYLYRNSTFELRYGLCFFKLKLFHFQVRFQWLNIIMKSLNPKGAKSIFVTSEKNEFVYQMLYRRLWKVILEGAYFHNCSQNLGYKFCWKTGSEVNNVLI